MKLASLPTTLKASSALNLHLTSLQAFVFRCPSPVPVRTSFGIKRRVYATREDARADIFDYIEMFYNPIRRHGHNNGLSPVQFEKQFSVRQIRV